ncbi:MAG: hypothetical protein JNM17_38865 [Archangium sp.]|nr:hypothetical protein [Archangium sp.]
MADYEFSTGYVQAVVNALRRAPKAQEIYGRLSYDARLLWDNPWSSPWQPATPFEEIGEIATQELGATVFNDLTHVTMKERMGPILLPMLKTTLAAKSPAGILKKLNDLVKVAIKGVEIAYQSEGTHAGVVTVVYPRPVKPHVMESWLGVIRFVFDITSPGQVNQSQQVGDDATLQFVLSWTDPPAAK